MYKRIQSRLLACLLLIAAPLGASLFVSRVWAQDAEEPAPQAENVAEDKSAEAPAEKAAEKPADGDLVSEQQQVADKFRELERLLLRMAELTAPSDPRRAALLKKAVAQSKDADIDRKYDALLELLRDERLSSVVKNQGEVQAELMKLLDLLLSEDRSKHLESEKERIRDYLKRVNKIIREQKSVQGETERDGDPRNLADRQQDLSKKTGELAKDLKSEDEATQPKDDRDKTDEPSGEPKEGEPKEGEPKEGEQGETKQPGGDKSEKPAGDSDPKDGDKKDADKTDAEKKDADKKDADKKDAEKKDAEKKDAEKKDDPSQGKADGKNPDSPPDVEPPDPNGGQPQDGKPQDGKPQQGKPQDGKPPEGQPQDSPQQEQNPAQQRIEEAQKRMEEAQKKLEEAKKQDATEKQAEAIKELEQAKAELEEILRQLREEELSRTLAMLEARFRKMLDAQVEVYDGTKRLDQVPQTERDREEEIESGRLSRKEAGIAVEAEKALALLRDEGSAVAFAEAVVEIRDDMLTVRDRLGEMKLGEVTLGVEQDIIAALEEMIAALDKAQKDLEDKQQQPPQPSEQQAGGDDEKPLVDQLSELKMIRAMQMRVNNRTKRYSELIKTEQAEEPEILTSLRQLAEREQRIHKVTRDIVVGRNR